VKEHLEASREDMTTAQGVTAERVDGFSAFAP
jgi:hypothetical protein